MQDGTLFLEAPAPEQVRPHVERERPNEEDREDHFPASGMILGCTEKFSPAGQRMSVVHPQGPSTVVPQISSTEQHENGVRRAREERPETPGGLDHVRR